MRTVGGKAFSSLQAKLKARNKKHKKQNKGKPTDFPYLELTKVLLQFRDLEPEKLNAYCAEILKTGPEATPGSPVNLGVLEKFSTLQLLPHWKKNFTAGRLASREPLGEGLTAIFETQTVALSSMFTLQIYQDVHNIMKAVEGSGFDSVLKTTKRVQNSVDSYFRYHDRMLPALSQKFTDDLKRMQEDSVFLGKGFHTETDEQRFIRHNHPLVWGLEEARLALEIYEAGHQLAEFLSLVRSSIHLYNALYQSTTLKEPWPAMEKAIEYFTPERVFVGPRPGGLPECLRRCELAEGASLTSYAKGTRDKSFKRASQPRRSIFQTVPVLEMLSKRYLGTSDGPTSIAVDQDLIEEIVSHLPAGKNNKSQKGKLRKQWDTSQKMGPVQVLTLLRDAVSESESHLSFDFFGAHRRAWQVLRTLWMHHQESITYWFPALEETDKDSVDKVLHALPLMILNLCNAKAGPAQEAGKTIMEQAAQQMALLRSEDRTPQIPSYDPDGPAHHAAPRPAFIRHEEKHHEGETPYEKCEGCKEGKRRFAERKILTPKSRIPEQSPP